MEKLLETYRGEIKMAKHAVKKFKDNKLLLNISEVRQGIYERVVSDIECEMAKKLEKSASDISQNIRLCAFGEAYEKWFELRLDADMGHWLFMKSRGIEP